MILESQDVIIHIFLNQSPNRKAIKELVNEEATKILHLPGIIQVYYELDQCLSVLIKLWEFMKLPQIPL